MLQEEPSMWQGLSRSGACWRFSPFFPTCLSLSPVTEAGGWTPGQGRHSRRSGPLARSPTTGRIVMRQEITLAAPFGVGASSSPLRPSIRAGTLWPDTKCNIRLEASGSPEGAAHLALGPVREPGTFLRHAPPARGFISHSLGSSRAQFCTRRQL
jgi:hypothetical protein